MSSGVAREYRQCGDAAHRDLPVASAEKPTREWRFATRRPWRNRIMSEARQDEGNVYDVVVIGAGPIGQNVADRAGGGGLSVAVVERELVGGECSYWGCVPSKALLRPVIAVSDARRVDGAKEAVIGPVDAAGVFGRRNRYVTNWDDSGQVDTYIASIGADLVRGHGRLDRPRRVTVVTPDDRLVVLTARHAVAVCTGSRATMPDLPGIAEARPW